MKALFWKLVGGAEVHGHRTVSAWKLGVLFVVFALSFGWASFHKVEIKQWFTPSETVKVHFAANNVVVPYYSKVKVNFVPAGLVTDLEELKDGTALVTVQIDKGIIEKLGTEPTATLRPTTLLGGYYFVDLAPGGNRGEFTAGTIPIERTKLPVELDKFIKAIQPAAQVGLRGFVKKFDETLSGGGREALQRLVADTPGALKPTGEVLDALRGTRPNSDLTDFVTGFEATARALTDKPGQLRAIATDLSSTAAAFGRQSAAFSSALDQLPGALTSADNGLQRLNVTLDVLQATAPDIRPSAKQLGTTLDELDPVLADARPLVKDLRKLMSDAKPTFNDLVPVTDDLTDVFDDFDRPVTDRINGRIKDLVLGDYHGTGPYAQTHTDKPIFEELGHMVNNLDRATLMDRNGGAVAFQPDPHGLELLENVFANNGQPRVETLQRALTDPQRITPPIQAPQLLAPPHPGSDNFGTGQQLLGGLGGGK